MMQPDKKPVPIVLGKKLLCFVDGCQLRRVKFGRCRFHVDQLSLEERKRLKRLPHHLRLKEYEAARSAASAAPKWEYLGQEEKLIAQFGEGKANE